MKERGFTLIEMILTIIIGGILVLGIAGFVELGARGYSDTIERQRLQTQAKFVLEKMSREVRHAVPNIFRSEDNCIYFFPIVYSGFYAVSGADLTFIVGQNDVVDENSFDSLSMIINPTASLAVQDTSIGLTGNVTAVSAGVYSIANEGANLSSHSVAKRHYIFDASSERSYCIVSGSAGQKSRIERDSQALTDYVVEGTFNYVPATVQANGLVHSHLVFSQGNENSTFEQDIQVINVP